MDVECAQKENFMAENHPPSIYPKQYIQNLYSSGLSAQLSFSENAQDKANELDKFNDENKEKAKKAKEKLFRKTIIEEIKNNDAFDVTKFDRKEELLNLFKLLCFIQAWADSKETWDIHHFDEFEKKKIRQSMKFKKDIDKTIRRSIHVGLFISVVESLLRFMKATKNCEEADLEILLKELEELGSIKTSVKKFKKFLESKEFKVGSDICDKNFLEAANLISTFTLWPEKIFNRCGIGMGLIAALACGLSTGGAIFVLLTSFSLPLGFVIPLSLLFFLAGSRANFQLFSQHIPRFLQDLCKSGGVTEFINEQGKSVQLSTTKKFLLLPAAFLSISVGMVTAAITVLEGTKIIAIICPMLAVACPYVPGILLGILASALLIGLSVVMFRAFIEILQSQFSWQTIKETIMEKWQDLNRIKFLAYAFKALIMVAALFGLFFLSITGAPTLAASLGWIAAYGISLAAFIGDIPFTLITALTFCTSLLTKKDSNSDLTKDSGYYLRKVVEFFALIINALGNAALVFTDSWVSRIASIACFMNSYANNRIQDDNGIFIDARAKATKKSLGSLACTFFGKSSGIQIPEVVNDVKIDYPMVGSNSS